MELSQIEKKIRDLEKRDYVFAEFLEDKMDEFGFSNTSLARVVYHEVTDKKTREVKYVPVTRQAIASWLKGTIPGSREIYISLGMAFNMNVQQINKELLEVYMGTGLYCKNVEDALWIAVVNRLFSLEEIETVRVEIEAMFDKEEEDDDIWDGRSIPTSDLWGELSRAKTKEEFFDIIRIHKVEFIDGNKRFGKCLMEVIEEEYGYFDKATEFLSDIGCLHCEAQFSKIRAGKAVVTREWLLRFCISLQTSYESIEKLLEKAQMEPLGITPVEVVIEMVAKTRSSQLKNSQEVWINIEEVCDKLQSMGYNMDEEIGNKYNSAASLTLEQKLIFSLLIGYKLLDLKREKDYGYQKNEYIRYQNVDHLLFEELNRWKKNATFKQFIKKKGEKTKEEVKMECDKYQIECFTLKRDKMADSFLLEKFCDYCYLAKPEKNSKDIIRNDIYFYTALLYSIFSGRCFVKDFDEKKEQYLEKKYDEKVLKVLIPIFYQNLGEIEGEHKMIPIERIIERLSSLSV